MKSNEKRKVETEVVKCPECNAPHRIPSNIGPSTPVSCECGKVWYPG